MSDHGTCARYCPFPARLFCSWCSYIPASSGWTVERSVLDLRRLSPSLISLPPWWKKYPQYQARAQQLVTRSLSSQIPPISTQPPRKIRKIVPVVFLFFLLQLRWMKNRMVNGIDGWKFNKNHMVDGVERSPPSWLTWLMPLTYSQENHENI